LQNFLKGLIGFLLLVASPVFATTSGVPGPGIKEGDRSWQYRSNYQDSDGALAVFNHRLHYQQAHSALHRSRIMFQQQQTEGESLELVWVRFEHQWQYQKKNARGTTGALRFDFQFAEGDDRRHFARVGWLKDTDIGDYSARLNLFVGRDFGDGARPGVSLAARSQLTRQFGDYTVGLQTFSSMNTTAGMGQFNGQRHQVGPIVSRKFGQWSVFASYLAGVTSQSPDDAFRLFVGYSL
jgi:hypothetical protein